MGNDNDRNDEFNDSKPRGGNRQPTQIIEVGRSAISVEENENGCDLELDHGAGDPEIIIVIGKSFDFRFITA